MSATTAEQLTPRSVWMTSPHSEPGESIALILLRDLHRKLDEHIAWSATRNTVMTADLAEIKWRQDRQNGTMTRHDSKLDQLDSEIRELQKEDRYEDGRIAGAQEEHDRLTGKASQIWAIGTNLFRLDTAIVLALGIAGGWAVRVLT